MEKDQFFSTLFAFIAAVCFGFAVELAVRLGDMYIRQGGNIAVFVSNTWQSLVVFICAGIFFLIISYLFNREAWNKADERERNMDKTLTEIKDLLRQILEKGGYDYGDKNNL